MASSRNLIAGLMVIGIVLGFGSGCGGEDDQADSTRPQDDTATAVDFEIRAQIKSPNELIKTYRTMCRVHSVETLAQQFRTSSVPSEVASALAIGATNAVPSARSARPAIRQACLTELLKK